MKLGKREPAMGRWGQTDRIMVPPFGILRISTSSPKIEKTVVGQIGQLDWGTTP
jgi:hypothetical protein